MSIDFLKHAADLVNNVIPALAIAVLVPTVLDLARQLLSRRRRRNAELEKLQADFKVAREGAEAAHERLMAVIEENSETVQNLVVEVGPGLIELVKEQEARIKELEAEVERLRGVPHG